MGTLRVCSPSSSGPAWAGASWDAAPFRSWGWDLRAAPAALFLGAVPSSAFVGRNIWCGSLMTSSANDSPIRNLMNTFPVFEKGGRQKNIIKIYFTCCYLLIKFSFGKKHENIFYHRESRVRAREAKVEPNGA